MSYRPYPNVDRALAQLERRRRPGPRSPLFAWIDEHLVPEIRLTDWQRAFVDSFPGIAPKRAGRTTTAAIVDQAVKAGEHVHVASHRDGVRCASGDPACSQAGKGPTPCPGCGHAQHAPGTECAASVDHGPDRWHRCLCLATPGPSKACPSQMNCQGGTLGYADIVHLREGGTLRGKDGVTITPDVLAEPQAPLSEDVCPGFPDRCPNLRSVEPDPPQHFGGVRCGCADRVETADE